MEKVIVAVVTTVLCSVFGAEERELKISGWQGEEVSEATCRNNLDRIEVDSWNSDHDIDFPGVYEISLPKK